MGRFIDICGQKFNRLTVIEKMPPDKSGAIIWKCLCECDNIVYARGNSLRNGDVKSCGCYRYEKISCKKSNPDNPRLYNIYNGIKTRCYNQNFKNYKYYGGKGITMCDEWKYNYLSFYNWAVENGYKEDLTIDRIDNNKGYAPENCRWATKKEQAMNTSANIKIKINGEYKTPEDISQKTGIKINTIYTRKFRGMSDEDIAKNTKHKRLKSDLEYKKTKRGVLVVKYKKYSSQHNVEFTLDQLLERFLPDKTYIDIFNKWVDSGYNTDLKPTLCKKNNKDNYTIENIMVLTVKENNNKRWNKGVAV